MDFLSLLLILAITYTIGSIIDKKHFEKIKKREIALIRKPVLNFGSRTQETKRKIRKVELVTGEVVISGDYFKSFVAALKNLFGGRLTSFESIMDRGRREALLRMREQAVNAHCVINTRIETVMLNSMYDSKSVPQCAIIAYGTAITYE